MAKISNKQYAQALYEITEDVSKAHLTEAINVFIQFLVRNHKLKQAGNIIIEFERIVKKTQGVVELEITSAQKLDTKIIEKIKKAFGEHVEAVTKIDENIIGGVKVQLEDKILDASLKTQLKLLKKQLAN